MVAVLIKVFVMGIFRRMHGGGRGTERLRRGVARVTDIRNSVTPGDRKLSRKSTPPSFRLGALRKGAVELSSCGKGGIVLGF